MDYSKIRLQAFLQGARDDSYDKKTDTGTQRVPRYLVDVYVGGLGALEVPVDVTTYTNTLKLPPMTELVLPVELSVQNRVVKSPGGRDYARRELGVRLGALELAQTAAKAG